MIFETAGYFVRMLLAKLPGWLIRRFYSPYKVAQLIDVDLRSNNPIIITFGTDIPSIDLYFQIYNRSPFDLVLDRLLIDFWVGQPTFRGAILRRYDVPKVGRVDNVYFGHLLTLPQQEQIKRRREGQLLYVSAAITLTAYFESKIGVICIEKRIDRTDVPCK